MERSAGWLHCRDAAKQQKEEEQEESRHSPATGFVANRFQSVSTHPSSYWYQHGGDKPYFLNDLQLGKILTENKNISELNMM